MASRKKINDNHLILGASIGMMSGLVLGWLWGGLVTFCLVAWITGRFKLESGSTFPGAAAGLFLGVMWCVMG